MTDNELAFVVVISFTAGHACAWLGMWLYWRRPLLGPKKP